MIYLVYIAVDRDRCDNWLTYMRDSHIQDVLDTGCFTSATLMADPDRDTETRRAFRAQYHAPSQAALDRYLSDHAPALKKDHTDRFAGSVDAHRDILPVIREYTT